MESKNKAALNLNDLLPPKKKKRKRTLIGFLMVLAFVVLFLWGLGALIILSLNTLFSLSIAYTWKTLLSAVFLACIAAGGGSSKR
jgi:hypothetical protein